MILRGICAQYKIACREEKKILFLLLIFGQLHDIANKLSVFKGLSVLRKRL